MEEPSLADLLARVHAELEHGQPLDDETRRLLGTVLADIQGVLARPVPPPSSAEHAGLVQRLRASTGHLEDSHPRLTATVTQLIDALSAIFK
jgi:hypothetical protein